MTTMVIYGLMLVHVFCLGANAASCLEGYTFVSAENICVKLFDNETVGWQEADTACRSLGQTLVSFHESDTITTLIEMIPSGSYAWAGHKDGAWSDGSPANLQFPPVFDTITPGSSVCSRLEHVTTAGSWTTVECTAGVNFAYYFCQPAPFEVCPGISRDSFKQAVLRREQKRQDRYKGVL